MRRSAETALGKVGPWLLLPAYTSARDSRCYSLPLAPRGPKTSCSIPAARRPVRAPENHFRRNARNGDSRPAGLLLGLQVQPLNVPYLLASFCPAADRVLRVSDIGDVGCIRSAISIVAE